MTDALADQLGRLWLVGEDNPYGGPDYNALVPYPAGCAGERLMRILALPEDAYDAISKTNLCSGGWNLKLARDRMRSLINSAVPGSVFVMLGRKVAQAFAGERGRILDVWGTEELCSWREPTARFVLVSIPHPSGRNTIWNDPATAPRARALLGRYFPGVPQWT